MKMDRRRLLLIATFAWVALLAAACSGAAAPVGGPTDEDFGRFAAPTAAPIAGPPRDLSADPGSQALPDQQLIVYTGSLSLEVSDINAAVQQAEQLVRGLGGHVASSQASDTDRGKSATVTYRIPAEHWSDALNGLKGLATRVVDENTSSEDVTAQVVDLDARLANLRVTEAALQTIMDRATTITDVLKVQTELTGVRGDIESLTAQRDVLANRAALATLEVGFNTPPVAEVSRQSESWNLGTEIDNALAALVRLGQWALSLAIWLVIVIVPLFVPIVVVIYLAFWLRRRWLKTHPPMLAAMGETQGGPWPPSV
jgi:hypothetical protein